MTGSGTATAGLAVAATGLIVVLVTWPSDPGALEPVIAVVSAGTAGSFSARRHGWIDRRIGGALAGIGGLGLAIGGLALFVLPSANETAAWVPLWLGLAGLGCVVLAAADGLAIPQDRLGSGGRALLLGAALGFAGLFVAGTIAVGLQFVAGLIGVEPSPVTGFALQQAGMGIGLVLASLGFVLGTSRGWGYLDLDTPDRTELAYVLGGILAIVGVAIAIGVLYTILGIEGAEHDVIRRGREDGARLVLVAIPFAWVATALGEELLFRNGVQKYLTERFTPAVAIVASSAIFTAGHAPAFGGATPGPLVASLLIVFSLSLILGVAYERTSNVVVPILIHGTYNVLVYLAIFAGLS